MVIERQQHFIDGQWTNGSGQTFEVVDPATEEVIAQVAAGGAEQVQLAVDAAVRAQRSWGRTSGSHRADLLRAMGEAIEDRQRELAELEVRDNGKPLPEAEWDVADAVYCFRMYADLAEELVGQQGEQIKLPDGRFSCQVYHEPVGPSGLIVPWNYPLLMAAWKVAPALAAGCTAVLKPSELTPLSALELADIAQEVGLPKGVLNVVTGTGPEAGAPLAEHPKLAKIAFTGSVPTGQKVMRACAQEIKNVSLELGGKSPILVFDDTSLEAAVEWIMFGIFWNQGQVCSATSRLLVQDIIADRLLDRLVAETTKISIGSGMEDGVKLGPLVSASQRDKVDSAVHQAVRDGGRVLCGGGPPADRPRGYFYSPTIIDGLPLDSQAWREEIFGPVLVVQRFQTEEQAVRLANDSDYGLAAAVMSGDLTRAQKVVRELEAGIVWVNCSQPTFSEAPWGGMKHSGIGRELGRWGLENYLQTKQVTTYRSPDPWGWYLQDG